MDPTSGTTDMANVSGSARHPPGPRDLRRAASPGHSIEFRDAAGRPRADGTVLLAATLVAQTALRPVRWTRRCRRRRAWRRVPRTRGLTRRSGRDRSTRRTRYHAARLRGHHAGARGAARTPAALLAASEDHRGRASPRPGRRRLRRAQRLGPRVRDVRRLRPARRTSACPTFMKLPWVPDPAELAGAQARTSRSSARRSTTPSATAPAPASARGRSARPSTRPARSTRSSSTSSRSRSSTSSTPATRTSSRPGSSGRTPSSTARSSRSRRPVPSRSSSAATTRSRGPSATAVAEVRRPGSIGIVHFDAHADTANDDWGVLAGHGTPMRRLIEIGRGQGPQLRPGGPARLLAAGRDLRVDAGARAALAPHARDRGARRRGGHRRRHRRGARRPGRRSTSRSTSTSSTRAWHPGPARRSPAGC